MSTDAGIAEIERLLAIVRELREKCPWDREQTVASVGRDVIEEAYEAADAIVGGSAHDICEELGDVLVQVLFIGVIAADEKRFSLADIAKAASDKLIRRHPHIYADAKAETVDQVLSNWEKIKSSEKKGKPSGIRETGRALPALMRAEKLGEKARLAGMDWQDARAVLKKVREELEEAEEDLDRGDNDAAASEIGDMMLALANAPRFIGHNAEQTLRRACEKFIGRFEAVEKLASERGLDLKKLSGDKIESLWQEVKRAKR